MTAKALSRRAGALSRQLELYRDGRASYRSNGALYDISQTSVVATASSVAPGRASYRDGATSYRDDGAGVGVVSSRR